MNEIRVVHLRILPSRSEGSKELREPKKAYKAGIDRLNKKR